MAEGKTGRRRSDDRGLYTVSFGILDFAVWCNFRYTSNLMTGGEGSAPFGNRDGDELG